jgi:hypothetical protein
MTAEFESIAETLLVILTVVCILQAILVGLLLRYVRRMAGALGGPVAAAPLPPAPVAAEVPAPAGKVEEEAVPAPAPAVDILGDSRDIRESVQRLSVRHGLSGFTLATLDGLVVVSLSPGSSEEAARFSDLYRRRKKPDTPGVTFLEISHHGEAMLGILRAEHPLSQGKLREIAEDTRKILNWWL